MMDGVLRSRYAPFHLRAHVLTTPEYQLTTVATWASCLIWAPQFGAFSARISLARTPTVLGMSVFSTTLRHVCDAGSLAPCQVKFPMIW